jgi:F-type H+-transporting ATPase subunit beta
MQDLQRLVESAKQGDSAAFDKLVLRFQDMAYAIAFAMLGDSFMAQDAAQEAFIEAYLSLVNLRIPQAFPNWFRRIVIKHSDRQIRGAQHRTVPLDSNINLPAAIADPETALEESQTRQAIQLAVAALPSTQRQITTLFYIKGYSQNEISDFLELPLTSIKKSLYTARKRLKHRMINMLQDQLQSNKPSRDDAFTNKVKYFLALKAGNLKQVKALIEKDRRLLVVQTEWGVASDGFYWPLGVTGLHWAAITGDQSLLEFFINQGADPNTLTSSGMTPLHLSVLMRQTESIRLLLASGVDVNAKNNIGFTPLHFAILRNKPEIADLLINNGADLEVADNKGRKPIDWAWEKSFSGLVDLLVGYGAQKPDGEISKPPQKPVAQHRLRKVPVGERLLGRVLDPRGQSADDLHPIRNPKKQPIYHPAPSPSNWIMETGIKVIDLLTPFKRGGHHGIFTPLPGVGKFVILAQLIENLIERYDGYSVCIGLEEAAYTGKSMMLAWREWGVDERTVNVFNPNNSSTKANLNLVQTGLTIAEDFRSQGHEVILLVDSRLALNHAVFNYLKYNAAATPRTAITTVYSGDYSVGAEPDLFKGLDATVTFNQERVSRGLWPAIDPLASKSRLLQSPLFDETHRMVAARARNLLIRYNDLFPLTEKRGNDALTGMQDRQDLLRGGLLQNFLTQPFTGAEPWTGVPGENLEIGDTILSCQKILDGKYDALPLESFYLIGTVDQAVEKARNLQSPNLAGSSVSPH